MELHHAEYRGLVAFLGAFMSSDMDVSLALEYMDAGSLEDVMRMSQSKMSRTPLNQPHANKTSTKGIHDNDQTRVDHGNHADGDGLGRTPIPMGALGKIAADVLMGLMTMHNAKTVHRDIKPANILVSSAGQAKLSDFGIAATREHTLAQCQTYAGTVTYMSPERIHNLPYGPPVRA